MQKPITDLIKIVKFRDNPTKYSKLLKNFDCGFNNSGIEYYIRESLYNDDSLNKTVSYLLIHKETESLFGVFSLSTYSFISDFENDESEEPLYYEYNGEKIKVTYHHPSILLDNYALDVVSKQYISEYYEKITPLIFNEFIFPQIKKICNLTGAEYAVLFAADNTNTEDISKKKLINLYKTVGFNIIENSERYEYKTPFYDLGCEFMIYKI